jgi:hypothetical protein
MAERKAFLLRMEPGLWAELEAWAADELRSVNGQIEYVLKQAVAKRKGPAANPPPPFPRSEPEAGASAT